MKFEQDLSVIYVGFKLMDSRNLKIAKICEKY